MLYPAVRLGMTVDDPPPPVVRLLLLGLARPLLRPVAIRANRSLLSLSFVNIKLVNSSLVRSCWS